MDMNGYLSENVKITKCADHATAATSDVTGAELDMAGFDGVMFLTSFGTAAANNKLKVQQSDTAGSGHADTVAEQAAGTSDEDVVVDVLHPTKRYVQAVAVRGTSSTCESIWAVQYRARSKAQSNDISGTIAAAQFNAPAAA